MRETKWLAAMRETRRITKTRDKSDLFIVNNTICLGLILQVIVQNLYKLLNKNVPYVTDTTA